MLYAGGQSDKAKSLISGACEAYVMHGDPADRIAPKVADMRARRDASGGSAMQFGMAAYIIVRDSEAEAVGTPEYVADRIREFEATGVDLLLLQCSPHLEEMERVAEQVMSLVRARALHLHEVAA